MLNARYLATLSDDIVRLYADLERDIKIDMVRRLAKMQRVTDTALWQARILKEMSGLKSDISRYIKSYNKKSHQLLKSLYEDAMSKAMEQDVRYYELGKRSLSASQSQIMNASVDRLLEDDAEKFVNKTFLREQEHLAQIENSLARMTLSVADVSEKEFLKECNAAYMKVSSGAFSADVAYKDAVNALADRGVRTVTYTSSGKMREFTIEAATRMNVLTGINQTASQQTLDNADALGSDLVEVSAHIGARPEHAEMQGKVYCLNGERDYTDSDGVIRHAYNFYEVCRYGEADGICGINCRHSFYPYFEGTPLLYDKGVLDEMSEERVMLDGKSITPYEAEQDLRLCERAIRQYKTRADCLSEAGMTETQDYIDARNRISKWQEKARHITNQTGIKRDYINEYVGTASRTQPRGKKK